MNRTSIRPWAVLAAAVLIVAASPAAAGPGACVGYDLSGYRAADGGFDPDGRLSLITRAGAAVHDAAVGGVAIAAFGFSAPVRIVGAAPDRVLVRKIGETRPLGWVDRADLLCRLKPLRDARTGLERKAFIRTETAVADGDGGTPTITAYPAPTLDGCAAGSCRELSRFELYFVADETDDAILLTETFVIDGPHVRLVGWVAKQSVILWNWALGVRPAETLSHDGGIGSVCAYVSAADAAADRDCQPILGGRDWFRSWFRLPILAEEDGFYRIAVPSAAIDERNVVDRDDGTLRVIDPTQVREIPVNQLKARNRIDVFFLIDGTRSMTPWIDAIRGTAERPGVVQAIAERLRREAAQGAVFRYGFRVYRDTGGRRGDGLGAAFGLASTDCLEPDRDAIEQSHQAFQQALLAVETTVDDRDDFPENTFGGLKQALRDVRGCGDNTKLVFVIGDAGYDVARQRSRGRRPVSARELALRVNARPAMAVFFVRPPRDHADFARPDLYDDAHDLFGRQALDLLGRIETQAEDRAAYFIDLPADGSADRAILDQIVGRVGAMTRPDLIAEIEVDLRGGAALEEIIDRLRRTNDDVPMLFWKLVHKSACDELKELCQRRIYQNVGEVLVPVSESLVEEVWLRADDLLRWQNILRPLRDVDMKGRDRRRSLVNVLVRSLENAISEPPFEDTGETFADYLKRAGGLPLRARSPLLSYSPDALTDPARVPSCELDFIALWARRAGEILNVAYDGRFQPVWYEAPGGVPTTVCPTLSANGRRLPFVTSAIDKVPLGPNDDFSYATSFRRTTVYWIPQDYLP